MVFRVPCCPGWPGRHSAAKASLDFFIPLSVSYVLELHVHVACLAYEVLRIEPRALFCAWWASTPTSALMPTGNYENGKMEVAKANMCRMHVDKMTVAKMKRTQHIEL